MEGEINPPNPPKSPSPVAAKGWKVRRVGSVTFAISKPKRNRRKLRQSRIRNRRRGR